MSLLDDMRIGEDLLEQKWNDGEREKLAGAEEKRVASEVRGRGREQWCEMYSYFIK